jgi:hypothetical protein
VRLVGDHIEDEANATTERQHQPAEGLIESGQPVLKHLDDSWNQDIEVALISAP